MHSSARKGLSGRLVAVVIIVLLVASIGAYALYVSTSTPPENTTFMLDFSPNVQHTPYYYGVAQGFYRNNGLNVSLVPGKGSTAVIAAIAAGKADFGLADTTALILSQVNSNISNVKVVSIIWPNNFYGIIYNKATISTVADINGKSGAESPSYDITTSLFNVFLTLNHINKSSLSMTVAAPGTYNNLVSTGKVQFIVNPVHNFPLISSQAKKSGIQLGDFAFANFGVNVYGQALIASASTIQAHPVLVRRFVLATLQSIQAAIANPTEAVAAIVKAQPQLNSTIVLAGFETDVACCSANSTSGANPLTLGWIDPQKMQQTVNLYTQGAGIKQSINASSLYTDSYVLQP